MADFLLQLEEPLMLRVNSESLLDGIDRRSSSNLRENNQRRDNESEAGNKDQHPGADAPPSTASRLARGGQDRDSVEVLSAERDYTGVASSAFAQVARGALLLPP